MTLDTSFLRSCTSFSLALARPSACSFSPSVCNLYCKRQGSIHFRKVQLHQFSIKGPIQFSLWSRSAMPTCSCWAVFALRLLLRQPSARGKRHSGHLASTSSCGKVDELKIEVHFSYIGIEVGSFSSPPSLLTKCCEVPQLLDCAMCPAGGASEKKQAGLSMTPKIRLP